MRIYIILFAAILFGYAGMHVVDDYQDSGSPEVIIPAGPMLCAKKEVWLPPAEFWGASCPQEYETFCRQLARYGSCVDAKTIKWSRR